MDRLVRSNPLGLASLPMGIGGHVGMRRHDVESHAAASEGVLHHRSRAVGKLRGHLSREKFPNQVFRGMGGSRFCHLFAKLKQPARK